MDMKRMLQAMDGISTKPVEGVNSMSKFLRVVKEADINIDYRPAQRAAMDKINPADYSNERDYAQAAAAAGNTAGTDAMKGVDFNNPSSYAAHTTSAPQSTTTQKADPRQDIQANGKPTYTADELADINDPDAAEWVAVREQLVKAQTNREDPVEIAKLQARYNELAGGNADRWEKTYAKYLAVQANDNAAGYNKNVHYVNSTSETTIQENSISKFLSIIQEGANPHKVALPVQMAMQHYQKPQETVERRPRIIDKYFTEAEAEITQRKQEKRALINQYASVIAERVLMKESAQPIEELSTELLGKYKKAAYADAKKADADGDYTRGDKRFKNINKATNKQFANDLKKHGQQAMSEELDEDLQRLYNLRNQIEEAIKQRLDPKCWKGKHKEGTKIKGGTRVNNCVPNKK
jgi:hypothetical protein